MSDWLLYFLGNGDVVAAIAAFVLLLVAFR